MGVWIVFLNDGREGGYCSKVGRFGVGFYRFSFLWGENFLFIVYVFLEK